MTAGTMLAFVDRPPGESFSWAIAIVFVLVACGTAALITGAWKWVGIRAFDLRVAGWFMYAIAALLAFAYVPISGPALIAILPSLQVQSRPSQAHAP